MTNRNYSYIFYIMAFGKEYLSESLFREKSHEHGLRVTPQRLAIFSIIQKSNEHPNADSVFRKVRKIYSNISFDTVNRTLLTFARIGILKVVEGYGYPKRFDPKLDNHHHFHCTRCNNIIDFHEKAFDDIKIPGSLAQQYIITDKKVILEGICNKCRK